MDTLREAITTYQTALDQMAAQPADSLAALVMSVLLARDHLARALARSGPAVSDLSAIAALDQRLQESAPRIDRIVTRPTLAAWRETAQPQANAWWWRLDELAAEGEKAHPLWMVVAVFFLTVSLSLTADIARRFLAAGPDFVGVFSTIFQVFFTFLAGRSLTEAGQRSLERVLLRVNIKRRYSYLANTVLALAVLLLIFALRLSLPTIARHYNNQGVQQQQSNRISPAIQSYQRAISLSTFYAQAHYNLGTAYEQSLTYDLAIASYQAALRTDSRMVPAYNNLARVYLAAQSNYGNALTLLNIALDLVIETQGQDQTILRYSLYKNRGWANLGLRYLLQAESDLRQALELRPDGAAAHCLMAQVLEARNDTQAARRSWENCLAYEKLDAFVPAEARWLGQARERLSEGNAQ